MADDYLRAQIGVMLRPEGADWGTWNENTKTWATEESSTSWPLVDYATDTYFNAPPVTATSPNPSRGFRIKYPTAGVTFSRGDFLYVNTAVRSDLDLETFSATDFLVHDPQHDTYLPFSGFRTMAGSVSTVGSTLSPGNVVLQWQDEPAWVKMDSLLAIQYAHSGGHARSYTFRQQQVGEIALFSNITPPYNPEISSYQITPVLPDSGSVSYTTMNGRMRKTIYSAIQYHIAATFSWSDQGEQAVVFSSAFAKILSEGTPILFLPPTKSSDISSREAYLLYLSESPVLKQTDSHVWSVSFEGDTQP